MPAMSRSASSIVADTASGSHCLKVDGFARTKGLPAGERLRSSPFTVGGHRWHIFFQPNSDGTEGTQGYVSVCLVLDDDVPKPVRAQFWFTVGAENRPLFFLKKRLKHAPLTPRVNICNFSSHGAWGFSKFLNWADLEKKGYLKYDCFMIKCDIVVINEFRTVGTTSATPPAPSFVSVPPSDLCQQLGLLLDTEKGADVVFQVGGETFAAHRCVLAARSPVFSAELFGAMIEGSVAHIISIDDMEAQVFRALLCFIYTDSLPEIKKGEEDIMFQHLLVAADRYNIERLKLICEEKLCEYIDVGTVAAMLVLADQQGCDGLKKACFNFLNLQQT